MLSNTKQCLQMQETEGILGNSDMLSNTILFSSGTSSTPEVLQYISGTLVLLALIKTKTENKIASVIYSSLDFF